MPENVTMVSKDNSKTTRTPYETPRIQVMTEREILNTFQLTQSMAAWWATASMC